MRFAPLLLLALGCAPGRADWADVPITSARFDAFDLSTLAVVGGAVEGDARLVWDGPAGGGALPVHLGGGTVGLEVEMLLDFEGHDGPVEVDLARVDDPTVGDVLGTYHGTAAGAGALIGATHHVLRNGRGAALDESAFEIGVGMGAGLEWVTVRAGGDDVPVDSGAADTGHLR